MRYAAVLLVLLTVSGAGAVMGKPLEAYISEAQSKQSPEEIDQAVEIMQKALEEYPGNPTAMAYLGGYIGIQSGHASSAGNMNDAGRLVTTSFEYLDKALAIDKENAIALFYRGVMGVNVPEFFGKLDQSITDLETLRDLIVKNPGSAPDIIRFQALVALGDGYDKKGEQQKALETWRNVVELAPNTPWAEQAEKKLKSSAVRREDSKDRQKKLLNRLGATSPVIKELSGKLEKDPDNPRVLYDLAMAIGVEAEKGYDARIYEDTTFRTNIAIEMVNLLDRASKLAPDDQNIRLACGMTSVTMPFFVNRLDKGMDDLKKVIDSSAPDSLKAEAHYWLGYAYSKKATTEWIEVISKYPDSREAAMSFEEMTPQVRHFDRASHSGPVVAIDFILGFRDELAPQTAVWIVDGRGKFIRTLYVSGFSGFIREKQVNLPEWAKSSGYSDADAVTGASIDTGHHLYVWDLTDSSGKKVGSGTYTVQVEACYWPSMNYQATSIPVTIGKKEYSRTVEEGNIIPYLGVVYYP